MVRDESKREIFFHGDASVDIRTGNFCLQLEGSKKEVFRLDVRMLRPQRGFSWREVISTWCAGLVELDRVAAFG